MVTEIIKVIQISVLTFFYLIIRTILFIIGKPFFLEYKSNVYLDTELKSELPNYQFSKNVNVKYKHYKSVFHFMWGFKPIKIEYLNSDVWTKSFDCDKHEIAIIKSVKREYKKLNLSLVTKEFVDCEPSIIKSLKREYKKLDTYSDWDRLFLMFDLHGTIIKPNRIVGSTDIQYYPFAKETLQLISNRDELDLNIYTCSHEYEVKEYQKKFKNDGIFFKYVNENPDVETNGYGNYDKKPYMNILFEDKAGWDPHKWKYIYDYFKERYRE